MLVALSTESKSKKKPHIQREFEKLWEQVRKKQLALDRLTAEMQDLRKLYDDKILPLEQSLGEPFAQLAERLIDFFPRKTLGKGNRVELEEWIFECIEKVVALGSTRGQELESRYNQALADFLEMDVDEMLDEQHRKYQESMEESDWFDEEDDLSFFGSDGAAAGFQESLFDFEDEVAGDTFGFEPDTESIKDEDDIFSGKWLRTLFRRTAKALHPDREMDESRRLEKQGLMTQLLAARDSKDVFTMLRLHHEYVDSSELLMDKQLMQRVCNHLEDKRGQLNDDRENLIYSDPVNAMIYRELRGKGRKALDKAVREHRQLVTEVAEDVVAITVSLRNLSSLKNALNDRRLEYEIDEEGYSQDELDRILEEIAAGNF